MLYERQAHRVCGPNGPDAPTESEDAPGGVCRHVSRRGVQRASVRLRGYDVCFECDRWFCRRRLTRMAVVVRPMRTETLACPACLEDHLFAPRSLRELPYDTKSWPRLLENPLAALKCRRTVRTD